MLYISDIVELKQIHVNKAMCLIIEQMHRHKHVISGTTQKDLKWGMVKANSMPHPHYPNSYKLETESLNGSHPFSYSPSFHHLQTVRLNSFLYPFHFEISLSPLP